MKVVSRDIPELHRPCWISKAIMEICCIVDALEFFDMPFETCNRITQNLDVMNGWIIKISHRRRIYIEKEFSTREK